MNALLSTMSSVNDGRGSTTAATTSDWSSSRPPRDPDDDLMTLDLPHSCTTFRRTAQTNSHIACCESVHTTNFAHLIPALHLHCKNVRISADISRRVFHILHEPGTHCNSVDLRIYNVYGGGFVKIWKTRHKISADKRIFSQCMAKNVVNKL